MSASSPMTLALGIVGTDALHKDTWKPLIEDLVAGHRREYRGSQIVFIISVEPEFTDTHDEMADFALTSGYKFGLLGHQDHLLNGEAAKYVQDARDSGHLYSVVEESSVHKGIAGALAIWGQSRLLLLGDPNEDDYVYASTAACLRKSIQVRSLPNALDNVEMQDDEEEQTQMPRADHEDDEFEEEEDFDDDDLDEDTDEDDSEEDDEGGDEDEAEEDDSDEEDEDSDDADEEDLDEDDNEADDEDSDEDEDVVEDEDDSEDEDDVEDVDDDEEAEDEESDDEEEDEEMATKAATTRWTERKLNKLADDDYAEFKDVAASFGVQPGRGIKRAMMIERILDAQDGKKPARTKTKAPVAAPRRTTKIKATRSKPAAAPKKATTRRSSTSTKSKPAAAPVRRPAVSSNGSAAALKEAETLMDLAMAATKVARRIVRQNS